MRTTASAPATFANARYRRRLRFRVPRGRSAEAASWFGLLITPAFAAVGVWLMASAPDWSDGWTIQNLALAAFAAIFAGAGVGAFIGCWHALRAKRRLAERSRAHPHEPWMADFLWSTTESHDLTGRRLAYMLGTSVGLLAFGAVLLLMGLQVLPGDGGVMSWVTRIAGVVVVGLGLAALGYAAVVGYRRLRFGRTRVCFPHFPLHIDEPIELAWICPGLAGVTELSFTLCYIEEELHVSRDRHGEHKSWQLYECWSDRYTFNAPGRLPPDQPVEVGFLLPDDAPSTRLNATQPRYWELVVHAKKPGIDFHARYLLPVYAR